MKDYSKNYTEEGFWKKLANYAKIAGRKVVETALMLYYCMKDPDTPYWAKTVIAGMLGYFILPIDAIPDFIPGGYTDDFGVFTASMLAIAVYIKPEHRKMAEEKVRECF